MIIPDNVSIVFKASNEVCKKDFVLRSFLINLAPLVFLSASYLIFNRFFGPLIYFIFVLLVYSILSFLTINKTYKHYKQYFGNDELAFSESRIYYNICMNIKGIYTNLDSSVLFKDVKCVEIKKGIGPKKLYLFLNDDSYITIHALKDIDDVKKNIENKLNK